MPPAQALEQWYFPYHFVSCDPRRLLSVRHLDHSPFEVAIEFRQLDHAIAISVE
jgi:hypothetical protein